MDSVHYLTKRNKQKNSSWVNILRSKIWKALRYRNEDICSGWATWTSHIYMMWSRIQTISNNQHPLWRKQNRRHLRRIMKTRACRHSISPFPLFPSVKQNRTFSGTENLISYYCKEISGHIMYTQNRRKNKLGDKNDESSSGHWFMKQLWIKYRLLFVGSSKWSLSMGSWLLWSHTQGEV